MIRWFAVHTQANAEHKAKSHLESQGFRTYLPRYLATRRHARQTKRVPAALFPRYLFVAFDPLAARWRAIQSTIGVSRLVGPPDKPTPVPEDVISALLATEDAAGFCPVDRAPRLSSGDPVRILSGTFAEAVGRFYGMSGDERVLVLLELLGRHVSVRLPVEAVTAEV